MPPMVVTPMVMSIIIVVATMPPMVVSIIIVVIVVGVAYSLFPHECWAQRRLRLNQESMANVVVVVHESTKHALPSRPDLASDRD